MIYTLGVQITEAKAKLATTTTTLAELDSALNAAQQSSLTPSNASLTLELAKARASVTELTTAFQKAKPVPPANGGAGNKSDRDHKQN